MALGLELLVMMNESKYDLGKEIIFMNNNSKKTRRDNDKVCLFLFFDFIPTSQDCNCHYHDIIECLMESTSSQRFPQSGKHLMLLSMNG
jgi:hypothetical protein